MKNYLMKLNHVSTLSGKGQMEILNLNEINMFVIYWINPSRFPGRATHEKKSGSEKNVPSMFLHTLVNLILVCYQAG